MQIIRNTSNGILEIVMQKPADFHNHFREGARLRVIAPLVARQFGMALAMPNLDKPLTIFADMLQYSSSIRLAANDPNFRHLLTLYMTAKLDPKEVGMACEYEDFAGIKYYPAGLTTKSEFGLTDPSLLWTKGTLPYQCLEVLAKHKKVFLIHAADGVARKNVRVRTRQYRPGDELDAYDQEPHFVAHTLPHIREAHPSLKISFEHMSTIEGAEYLREFGGSTLGCSLTPQHLLTDRRDTHRGGLRPHNFWFPVPQALEHRQELQNFVRQGHRFVWLGSDSAPHFVKAKERDCCAGGVMTAHACIELYAEAFESISALIHFEAFASINGPEFFGFRPTKETIRLVPEEWKVKDLFYVEEDEGIEPMRPFRLGEKIKWKLAS
ncbi:MAG TPA: hypothetical protein VN665_02820 [Candidatus Paceibacterota bacterium]|nr:hypothetical protein [Candidatus Paceibacterota bacterium]